MLSKVVALGSIADIQAQEYKTLSQETQTFAEGQLKEFKMQSDTTVKRMIIRVWGTFRITHAGVPTYDEGGFLGRMLSFLQVSQGNDAFKSIDLLMARRLQHIFSKKPPSRRWGTGATAVAAVATAEASLSGAPMTAPATGQFIFIDEELSIDLEDPLASDFMQKQATLWSTHGKNNCRVRVQCGTLAGLHEFGAGGTSVVYDNISIQMELTLVTVPHVRENPKAPFLVYQESLLSIPVSSGSSNFGYQLPKSTSKILGMGFLVRDTSGNKKLSDSAIKRLRLKANNSREFLDTTFRGLQRMNLETFGPADANMVASRHPLQGFAYASFRRDGDIVNNGIPADLDSLVLSFESSGSGDTPSESGTIEVTVALQELRQQVI